MPPSKVPVMVLAAERVVLLAAEGKVVVAAAETETAPRRAETRTEVSCMLIFISGWWFDSGFC